jgi:hypothetical protein
MVSQLCHYHGLNSLNHIGRVGINDYSSCLTMSQARPRCPLGALFFKPGDAQGTIRCV